MQSIAVARAGSKIYCAGKIGADGRVLLDALRENGVDTNLINPYGSYSGQAVIQVNSYGNSRVMLHEGANREITRGEIDRLLNVFNAGDILIIQNGISNIPYIIDKAFAKYIKIALNPSPIDVGFGEIDLGKVSYLIINQAEGEEITGESRPNKMMDFLLNRYRHMKVALTLGQTGALYGDEMNRIQQAAYNVEAVDTTAAGDTFSGYFISAIAMGAPSWAAMRMAARAAALSVAARGSLASIPTREETLRFTAAKEQAWTLKFRD